jgi:hypothetical protein
MFLGLLLTARTIQYVHSNSQHTDPLHGITPAKFISTQNYDREKYLEMILDSAEAVLSVFGFNRSLLGFDEKKNRHWWSEIYQQRERDVESAKTELYDGSVQMSLFPNEDVLKRLRLGGAS